MNNLAENNPTLSIVIVTFNHESEILPCLNAIWSSEGAWRAETNIVDNASTDKTVLIVKEFSAGHQNKRFQLRLIASRENTGFTRGTNLGLQNSRGDFILLLNPDTQVRPNALDQQIQFLKNNPDVGIVAPQLLFPNGIIQASCRRFPLRSDVVWHALGLSQIFPRSPLFNRWKMGTFSHTETTAVEQPQGAALMTHRKAFEKVGLLDESFPMFFSDVDWCKQFISAGWKIMFYPRAQIFHHKGSSIYRHRRAMIWSSHKSFIRYFQKHYSGFINQILNLLIAALLLLLAGIRILIESVTALLEK